MTPLLSDEERAAIAARVDALNATEQHWRSEIDSESGELVLHMPPHFGYENDCMVLGNIDMSDATDHALLDFFGSAPHDIKRLLAENAELHAQLAVTQSATAPVVAHPQTAPTPARREPLPVTPNSADDTSELHFSNSDKFAPLK